eukprot:718109-Prorocentrum_minimum.AAC.3
MERMLYFCENTRGDMEWACSQENASGHTLCYRVDIMTACITIRLNHGGAHVSTVRGPLTTAGRGWGIRGSKAVLPFIFGSTKKANRLLQRYVIYRYNTRTKIAIRCRAVEGNVNCCEFEGEFEGGF